jgi:hypothetical protein
MGGVSLIFLVPGAILSQYAGPPLWPREDAGMDHDVVLLRDGRTLRFEQAVVDNIDRNGTTTYTVTVAVEGEPSRSHGDDASHARVTVTFRRDVGLALPELRNVALREVAAFLLARAADIDLLIHPATV